MKFNWLWCVCALTVSNISIAAIDGEKPPFALTLDQVKHWSVGADYVDPNNISKVPLARRFAAPLNQQRAELDHQAKVLYVPDGLGNFAAYTRPQSIFNLYNFTHWSQIDLINFFGGTADLAVQVPSRPWVETAHKNGVKVLGSLFMAVAVYGGNPDTVEELLTQDELGRYIYAERLIEIAQYYGFDGWLINQETDLTVVKDVSNQVIKDKRDLTRAKQLARQMLAFMKYLTARAPAGMEIHWYDSMLMDGRVVWQNQLNQANQMFLQDGVASSDAIFLNYWWNKDMLESTHRLAKSLNRSPYDVYVGVDLWPSRNAQRAFSRTQWLPWLFDESGQKALGSIALFAPNFIYTFDGDQTTPAYSQFKNDAKDYASFYRTEERLFNGDDTNLAIDDSEGWPGIGRYLPARSTINSLPFTTNFSTGQGKVLMRDGQAIQGAWTDMAQQAFLPTWQFAVIGSNAITVSYDFDNVYDGGSSLSVGGDSHLGGAWIPLYQTDFQLRKDSSLELISLGYTASASLYLETVSGERILFALNGESTPRSSEWEARNFSLSDYADKHITKLGLRIDAKSSQPLSIKLGKLTLK